jgi:hypothetical protein
MVPVTDRWFRHAYGAVVFLELSYFVWLPATATVLAALRVKRGWAVWLMGSAITAGAMLETCG